MYQRTKYSKGRASRRKASALLISLALLAVCLVGTTVAYLMAADAPIKNVFGPSVVTCSVNETSFNGTTKTNVTVQNTGDTEAYIRASIVVTWKDGENGSVYGQMPVAGTDYTIVLNEADWFLGSDGFYYYKYPVAAGASTNALITSCEYKANAPEGYGLNVEILGSAIQSVPISVVNENWPAVQATTAHGELSAVGS